MTKNDENGNQMSESDDMQAEDQLKEEPTEIEALQAQLELLEVKAAENLDGWQRTQAEFANYKKRVARDKEQTYDDVRGRVIKRYLEIIDDLERALDSIPSEKEEADWARGLELVYRKLLSYQESEGVVQMDVIGTTFDPNLHEAIAQEESEDYKSGEIIEVLQPGYLLGERVLRPAVVKVAI